MNSFIRPAGEKDLPRIAEIEIFNYRLHFYPIFRCDGFYFGELQVPALIDRGREQLSTLFVYDDGVVKGFVRVSDGEIHKLFFEPVLQGNGIGAALLGYAVNELGGRTLWALEKNVRAVAFYGRYGFVPTGERKPEEDTDEYLIRLRLDRGLNLLT